MWVMFHQIAHWFYKKKGVFVTSTHQILDKKEICILLATLADVLHKLKILKVTPSHEEVESVVIRAFLEKRLGYREGMTTYEVREALKVYLSIPCRCKRSFDLWSQVSSEIVALLR